MSQCTEGSPLGSQLSQEPPAQALTPTASVINTAGHKEYTPLCMGEIRDIPPDNGLLSHPSPSAIERDNYLNYMLHEETRMRRVLKDLRKQLVETNKAIGLLAGGIASVQAQTDHLSTQFDNAIKILHNEFAGL